MRSPGASSGAACSTPTAPSSASSKRAEAYSRPVLADRDDRLVSPDGPGFPEIEENGRSTLTEGGEVMRRAGQRRRDDERFPQDVIRVERIANIYVLTDREGKLVSAKPAKSGSDDMVGRLAGTAMTAGGGDGRDDRCNLPGLPRLDVDLMDQHVISWQRKRRAPLHVLAEPLRRQDPVQGGGEAEHEADGE